jgi:D-glycero-alpha-D-manno-heptose 1-phosphate guanylyltransferase
VKAIILAGGFGTRLRTVINNTPKVMASVNEKPFLEYILFSLYKSNIEEVVLSVHYLSNHIKDYFGNSYKGMKLKYTEESSPLGTGGAIKHSLSHLRKTDNILVMNGDSFVNCDLLQVIEEHKSSECPISMVVKKLPVSERYGTLEIQNNKIVSFKEKKPEKDCFINTGIYLISSRIFSNYNLPESFSFEKDFLQKEIPSLNINAIYTDSFFIDIGIPEDYKKAQTSLEPI